MNDITKKTTAAFKWSSITELLSKIINPVINMLLARILAPEVFGILATVTMVISFAEVFVESGFQKFLIQHDFITEQSEQEFMSVAFWANLIFSCIIWGGVIVFCQPLASIAGNSGLGIPIAIAGVTIPLYGVIGIQNCRLKKSLEFKVLFYVRIASAFVPLVVTLPLALFGFDYWSLIIGNITGVCVQSILLMVFGRFKPLKFFRLYYLKYMLGFGVWTLLDGIVVWATAWIDTLLISHNMTNYYLGLYKNSVTTITSFFTIITSALTPVLFSSLSRLKDDQNEFNKLFLKVQKVLCLFLLPISAGLYFYRDLVTLIMFGDKWTEASDIVGIISITTALRIMFVSFYSDLYRAKGKFYLPLILQLLDIFILIPTCLISVKNGFWTLVYARAFVKLDLVIPELILTWIVCKLSPLKTGKAILHPFIATMIMSCMVLILQQVNSSIIWSFLSILICSVIYFVTLFLFKNERDEFLIPVCNKIVSIRKKQKVFS